jgi:hypothetical protein
MNTCQKCGDETYVAFERHVVACKGCDRTAAFCRCQPVAAKPTWLRRSNTKDLTRSAA